MRAVIWNELGAQPELRDDLPEPSPGAGDVLVRVRASSVNPVDNAIAVGMLKDMVAHEFPVTLGRDFAGTVERAGDGVDGVSAGDEVLGFVPAMVPAVRAGSWAEAIAVPAAGVVRRPDGVALDTAGAAPLAAITAMLCVDALGLSAGDAVLIAGATGGVGTIAVQLATAAGATVIAPGLPDDEDFLREFGVSEIVPREGDVTAAVRERVPGGVDAIIDLVNYAPGSYDAALKDGGRVSSATGAAGDGPGRTNVMSTPAPELLARLASLLADGALRIPIQRSYELAEALEALRALGAEHTQGKIAIRVAGPANGGR
jgi:NADPH:quinone reductase-like Zn-dependent oxidoreductase